LRRRDSDSKLVYSTDHPLERICTVCRRSPCVCREAPSLPARQQVIRISLERKGRGGKSVTLLKGFQLTRTDRESLLKDLKRVCGSGGTSREDHIELQGDHREGVAAWLEQRGFRTRRSGG